MSLICLSVNTFFPIMQRGNDYLYIFIHNVRYSERLFTENYNLYSFKFFKKQYYF